MCMHETAEQQDKIFVNLQFPWLHSPFISLRTYWLVYICKHVEKLVGRPSCRHPVQWEVLKGPLIQGGPCNTFNLMVRAAQSHMEKYACSAPKPRDDVMFFVVGGGFFSA